MFRRPSGLTLATITSAAALCLTPAVAGAASVSYAPDGTLVFTAGPGEDNSLGVQPTYNDPSTITLYGSVIGVGAATPAGCTRWDPADLSSVVCPIPPAVRLELGDGKDWGYVSSEVTVPVTMLGGDGDDHLAGNDAVQVLDGGAGNDRIEGHQGDDTLLGGDGDDKVEGGAGADRVDGGAGDDLVSGDGYEGRYPDVIDGGPGTDRIDADFGDRFSPSSAQPPVTITLAGGADDGRPGEADDVRGIEKVAVNIAGTYTGTDGDETLEVHQVLGSVRLEGRGGADTLIGADGEDTIDGGAGADAIDAGFGDDTITPGPGRDTVSADRRGGDCGPLWCKLPYGNDTVLAADGEVDSISCGPGTDRVVADAADIVAADCETVERGGAPGGAAAPGQTAGGVTLKATVTSPATAVSRGMRVKVTGLAPKQRVVLTARSGKRIVAKGSAKAGRSGTATVVLRFTKAGKRAMRARKKATLVITGAGAPLTVVLRRGR